MVGIFSVGISQITQIAYLCAPLTNPFEMKRIRIILLGTALALLGLSGCQQPPKTTICKIEALQQQVTADVDALQTLESQQYNTLKSDFLACDSMLQYLTEAQVDASFEKLQYAQAYLLQFEIVKPTMAEKMGYLAQQLEHLKADLESQYLSDSLALAYFETENRVADTLHEQILYFKDRFGQCQKDINTLKKSWK